MKKNIFLTFLTLLLLLMVGCSSDASSNDNQENNNDNEKSFPSQMVWSVYSTGGGTYADAAAVSDVFTKEYDASIRLLPSDTGVGRMTPLKEGDADIGRVGEEYFYAFEGDLDFASKDWGPQDLRMIWGPIEGSAIGIAVREDSGIDTVDDLKGKTIAKITANPSVENKMLAYLAYADLTYDDVELIDLAYSEQQEAFENNQIDAILFNPFGSVMSEIESKVDYKWLDLDSDSDERWDRVNEISPTVRQGVLKDAAGMEDGEELISIIYSVPYITYADYSEDEVYELVKGFDEQFENYKDATNVLYNHDIDEVLHEPLVVPFHEGQIKYLKENDLWTEEAEEKNNELIERQEKLQEGWNSMDLDDDELKQNWEEWKKKNFDDVYNQ